MGAWIRAVSYYLPDETLTNEALAAATLRETEDEFVLSIPIKAELVLTVSGNDSESEEDDSALKDATLEDYLADPETFHEAGYTWKDYVRRADQYDLDLNDFTDLTEYLNALKKAKHKDE